MSKRRNNLKPKVGYEDLVKLFTSERLVEGLIKAKDITFREGYETRGYAYFDPRNGDMSISDFFIYDRNKTFESDEGNYPPAVSFILRGVNGVDDRVRLGYDDMSDLWDLRKEWMENHRIYAQPLALIGSVNDSQNLGFVVLQDKEIRDPRERMTSSRDLNVLFRNGCSHYPGQIMPEINQFHNGEYYHATCAHFNDGRFDDAFLKELKDFEIMIKMWKS